MNSPQSEHVARIAPLAICVYHRIEIVQAGPAVRGWGKLLVNPVVGLSAATVQTFMNLAIAKNLFTSTGGDLVAIKDIAIVDTTTQDLFDVPIA
jgi:Protein of unknown function (DUF2922)